MAGWAIAGIILAIISIGFSVYSMFQKPPAPPVPTPEQLAGMPTAEQGKPIPVLFGTRMINQPNVVWYKAGKYDTSGTPDPKNDLTGPQRIMISAGELG